MRKALVLLGVLSFAALPLFGQWHSDTRISNTASSSYSAYSSGGWSIAADAGKVYIVWRDYSFTQYVRGVVFPIGAPPAAGSGTALSTGSATEACIAAGDGTNAHAVWDYSNHLYYNGYNGSSWGSQYEHYYTGDNMRAQSIADNSAGTSFIVTSGTWYNPNFVYRVRYRERSAAGVWSPMTDIWAPSSSDYHYFVYPSICLTPNGTRHISMGIYRTAGPSYSVGHLWSPDGINWSHEYVLPANSAYHVYPTSICSDKDGNLYIAYLSYTSPYQVRVIDNVGGSWNTPVTISSAPSSINYTSICCDTAGTVWAAWEDRSGQTYEIYYATRPKGGSWSAPQELTSNDGILSRYPNITADRDGNVHLTWTDNRDGNYEVYYNWYSADTGTGPQPGARDLACTRILKPTGKISKDPVDPEAVVANLGSAADSCYAICKIIGPGSTYENGNEEGIVYLDSAEERSVSFPSWTPPGNPGDKYQVVVTVYLWPEKTINDDDSTNNTEAAYCTIGSAIEVDPIMVYAPQEGSSYDTLTPAATFENTGSETATDFYCYCEIISQGGFMTALYIDSFAVASLDPEATVDVTFAKWTCDDSLPYSANFYAAVPGTPERELLGIEWPVNFQGMPFTGIGDEDGPVVIKVTGSNPTSGAATLSYALREPTEVSITIYDVTGKLVRTLYDGRLAGSGELYWNGNDDSGRRLGVGLYFIRIKIPEASRTTKLILTH